MAGDDTKDSAIADKGEGQQAKQTKKQGRLNSFISRTKNRLPLTGSSRRKKLFMAYGAMLLVIIAGVAALIAFSVLRQDKAHDHNIVIGDITITQEDLDGYAAKVRTQLERYPDSDFGGDPDEVALHDLVLNAALKNEAKKHKVEVSDETLRTELVNYTKQDDLNLTNLRSLDTGQLSIVRAENEVYKKELTSKVLISRDLLMVNIWYGTKFHMDKDPATVKKLHNEAVSQLNEKFMPAMKSGKSVEEVAALADNYMDGIREVRGVDSFDIYSQRLVSTAVNYKAFITGEVSFNDIDITEDNGVKLENLYSTVDKIQQLNKPGEVSDVFASKSGSHMIIRLEAINEGEYNSWDDLLQSYLRNYVHKARPNAVIKQHIYGVIEKSVVKLTTPGLQEAKAQTAAQCAEHNITFYFRSYNTEVFGQRLGGTTFRHQRSAHNCGSAFTGTKDRTTSATSVPTIADNCYGPPPNWSLQGHPNASQWQQVINSSGTNVRTSISFTQSYDGFPIWTSSGAFAINQNKSWYVDAFYRPNAQPYTIQGYRTFGLGSGTAFPSGNGSTSVSGVGSTTNNPYSFGNNTTGRTVSASSPISYNGRTYDLVGYTRCDNSTGCHGGARTASSSVYVDLTSTGGYTDIYWHYQERDVSPSFSLSANCNTINITGPSDPNGSGSIYMTVSVGGTQYYSGWYAQNSNPSFTYPIQRYDQNSHTVSVTAHSIVPSGSSSAGNTTRTTTVGPCDRAPTFTLSANCTTITISSLADADHSGNIRVVTRVDGVQIDSRSTRGTFTVPYPTNRQDSGSHTVEVTAYSIKRDGSENTSFTTVRTATVSNCFSASCTGQSVTPVGTTVIYASGQVNTTAQFQNTGQLSWNASGRITTRGTLASTGQQITPTVPATVSGGTAVINYATFNLPASIAQQTVNMQILRDGNVMTTCTVQFDPFTDFVLGPESTAGELLPDDENPNQFRYRSRVNVSFTQAPTASVNFSGPNATRVITRNGSQVATGSSNGTYNRPSVTLADLVYNITPPLQAGDEYCGQVNMNATRGRVNRHGTVQNQNTPGSSAQACQKVVNKPYLKLYGNDIMAGGGFGLGCSATAANIRTYYRQSGGTYVGSSTQHAAFALGSISGFSSASLRTSSPQPWYGLSFANASAPGAVGNYNDTSTCLPDYFAYSNGATTVNALTAQARLILPNTDPKEYENLIHNGDLTLASLEIPVRGRKVLFVDGTLTIAGTGLTMNTSSPRLSRDDVPMLYIVARNIQIANSVNVLDGIYIAQPNGGSGGEISTCTDAAAGFVSCGNQLRINGAFIGKKINFLRTFGTLRNSQPQERIGTTYTCDSFSGFVSRTTTCAGEVFSFSPEAYLAPTPFTSGAGVGQFDSFSSPPPNL
jgi:hypothetical protein